MVLVIVNDFLDIAREAEKVLRDTKFETPSIGAGRNISEIDASLQELEDTEAIDPQVEAIQFPNRKAKFDYSGIQCWNCSEYGHSYIYCSREIVKPFCFKCGQRRTLTPKCTNKHSFQGNRIVGDLATGDSRPLPQTPSLK